MAFAGTAIAGNGMDNHAAVGTIGLAASRFSITELPYRAFPRKLDTKCCDSAVDVWAC